MGNGLVNGGGQHTEFTGNGSHTQCLVKEVLGLEQKLGGEAMTVPGGGRGEEGLGTALMKGADVAFDGGERDAEGLDDLNLGVQWQ